MDNLLSVAFEAHNAEKNRHRRYEVMVARDLLDEWTVAIRYGRTGQGSQEKRFASSKAEEIRASSATGSVAAYRHQSALAAPTV